MMKHDFKMQLALVLGVGAFYAQQTDQVMLSLCFLGAAVLTVIHCLSSGLDTVQRDTEIEGCLNSVVDYHRQLNERLDNLDSTLNDRLDMLESTLTDLENNEDL